MTDLRSSETKMDEKSGASKSDHTEKGRDSKSPPAAKGPSIGTLLGIAFLGTTALMGVSALMGGGKARKEIDWNEFRYKYLEQGEVSKLHVQSNRHIVEVFLQPDSEPITTHSGAPAQLYFTVGSADALEHRVGQSMRTLGVDPMDVVPIVYDREKTFFTVLLRETVPTVVFLAVIGLVIRSFAGAVASNPMSPFGFARAKVKRITKDVNIGVTFADVAGLEEAKVEVMEFVKFLRDPTKFKDLGAKIPKGALLTGSPGTGKTLLAKATAGEAKVPFLSISGSEFLELFSGVGPARVRDLFKQARESAPCIVFIDEIDAVGRKRSSSRVGGHDERENTLNQLLVEMDGFSTKGGVVVFAATNRADILDPALLRPGRFDRQINVDAADINGRRDIFLVHLRALKLREERTDVAQRLATLTPGFSGADIANVCNEAALIAARRNKDAVEISDFDSAIDRIIGGLEKKNKILGPEERRTVAYHEAGHAVAGWFLKHANPLLKVSIVPRGAGALGFAQYHPRDQYLYTQDQLLDMMTMILSGRASEQLFFRAITTGAHDDLKKVTRMAYEQVVSFGMNEKVGPLSFPLAREGEVFTDKPYSNATAKLMDDEAKSMIDRAYARAVALCAEHRDHIEAVAKRLLEREVLMRDDLKELVGPRPWQEATTFAELGGTPSAGDGSPPAGAVIAPQEGMPCPPAPEPTKGDTTPPEAKPPAA